MTLVLYNRKLGIGSGEIFLKVTCKYQTDPETENFVNLYTDCNFSPGPGRDRDRTDPCWMNEHIKFFPYLRRNVKLVHFPYPWVLYKLFPLSKYPYHWLGSQGLANPWIYLEIITVKWGKLLLELFFLTRVFSFNSRLLKIKKALWDKEPSLKLEALEGLGH